MENLVFATQGDEFSYHAEAARQLAGPDIGFDPKVKFGEVVRSSREGFPGLGVIAISTVAGTVDDSAREIVKKRPSALPPIVARTDIPIKLVLIGSNEMSEEEIARQGTRLLAQKPAYLQCKPVLDKIAPYLKVRHVGESIRGVREMLKINAKKDGNAKQHAYLAIGPEHAAEPLGGVIVGPEQVNPVGSITSFYALQRDPRVELIAKDPLKTETRTVVSVAHPEEDGAFEKVLYLAEEFSIRVGRFIPFDIGDFTKHDPSLRRGGGIFELSHDMYDPEMVEWFARVAGLHGNDEERGPFDAWRLGGFDWFPEEPRDLGVLAEEHSQRVALKQASS